MFPSASKELREDPYITALKLFEKKSSVRKVIMDYAEFIAAHTMRHLSNDCLKSAVFRVLGVGSGNGQTDLRILPAVAKAIESSEKRRAVIRSTIIEPSTMITEFKTATSCLPQPLADLADFSFEWHETTLQKFIDSYTPEIACFELVHFVASLYYMDAETSLISCYRRLVSGGAIFCILGAEDSFYPKLFRKLQGLVDLGSLKKFYTEVDFIDIAKRNNWKYEELSKAQYTVDISCCFDDSSTEGNLLLDFLTHKQDFRVTADRILYKDVMEFLNKESFTDENGKRLLKPEFNALVIYK